VGGGKVEEVMKDYPIIFYELSIHEGSDSKEIIVGVKKKIRAVTLL
jgi:hypothetical protein